MEKSRRDALLWTMNELLQFYRDAVDEETKKWAMRWLLHLYGEEQEVCRLVRERIDRMETDEDFTWDESSLFYVMTLQEHIDENGPFILEKARQLSERKEGSQNLLRLSLQSMALGAYLPGLNFVRQSLLQLLQTYRDFPIQETGPAQQPESRVSKMEKSRLSQEKQAVLLHISQTALFSATYALTEPQAYREIFAEFLHEAETDKLLWLHLAAGVVKAGEITLVPGFVESYFSFTPEQRSELNLDKLLENVLEVGELQKTYKLADLTNLKSEQQEISMSHVVRMAYLQKNYPNIINTIMQFIYGREMDRKTYYQRLLEKTKLHYRATASLYSARHNPEKEGQNSYLEKKKRCRLLFLQTFCVLAGKHAVQERQQLGKADTSGLAGLFTAEASILFFNTILLLNTFSPQKTVISLYRPEFLRSALEYFRFPRSLEDIKAFFKEFLPLLSNRDLKFFTRSLHIVELVHHLKRELEPRQKGKHKLQKKLKLRRKARAVSRKKDSYENYLRRLVHLKLLPQDSTPVSVSSINSLLSVFELGRSSAFILEECVRKYPRKFIPHLAHIFDSLHQGRYVENLPEMFSSVALHASGKLKKLSKTFSSAEKKTLLKHLAFIPLKSVRDWVLKNWDNFYNLDPVATCHLARNFADTAFLPRLLQEWRSGSKEAGAAIIFICNLHGPSESPRELAAIRQQQEQAEKLDAEIEKEVASTRLKYEKLSRIQQLKPYVEFTLRCDNCGKVQTQRFESLAILETYYELEDEDLDGLKYAAVPNNFIVCVRCKAVNEYSYLEVTREQINADVEMVLSIEPDTADFVKSQFSRLVFTKFEWIDEEGEELSPLQALEYYQRRVAQEPGQADNLLMLAEVYNFFNQDMQAAAYYARARELAPENPRIYYREGIFHLGREHYKEARRCFREFLRQADKAEGGADYHELLEDKKYARHVLEFSDGLGKEMGATNEVVSGKPKVGRNDPCPCGSGKKYKKCCGRS